MTVERATLLLFDLEQNEWIDAASTCDGAVNDGVVRGGVLTVRVCHLSSFAVVAGDALPMAPVPAPAPASTAEPAGSPVDRDGDPMQVEGEDEEEDGGGVSGGAVAAIVLVLLAIAGAIGGFFLYKRHRDAHRDDTNHIEMH